MNYYFHIQHIYIYIIIYNIIIISYTCSDIYSKHSMSIITEIKSLMSCIDLYIGNTSFGCNVTVAILKF